MLTQDKDFGELAFRARKSAGVGVFLVRLAIYSPSQLADRIDAGLQTRDDWTGLCAVLEETLVRIRPLPQAP